MVRMKSKVIDTFRSEQGAKDFLLLKSLTSTAAKAEFTAFDALHSLFQRQLAWRTEEHDFPMGQLPAETVYDHAEQASDRGTEKLH